MMDDGGFDEDFDFDNAAWPPNKPIRPLMPPIRGRGGFGMPPNNDRYNNAYGSYRGGYGPGGGFGPPPGPPLGFRGSGPRGPPPLGPRGPMVMFGRGFVPGGPPPRNVSPETRAFKYLLRCGVARESLKNLPKQMLLIMEPEYCGVCGMEFDSFVMSRIHYTSRNHSKNQRKWITQNTEHSTERQKKQIPLKARELYCELCDVHITSTTHADSHYSGKPHRAIVYGRKNPKNPFLLQKGMEDRVALLLKREKEHLPAAEKPAATAATEPKPAQPDLYCDICKTSVTCSEQMTMHLNGKRHLSKEKQHIIRVMNSQHGNNGVAAAEAAEPSAAPAAHVDGDWGDFISIAPAADDDGDWGNGSGTWEDT